MQNHSEQELNRWNKLGELRKKGFNFPNNVKTTASAKWLLSQEVKSEPNLDTRHTIAGRIILLRKMGKAAFFHVLDGSDKIQIYIRKDDISAEEFETLGSLDIGDIVEVKGFLFLTKTGEKTLHAEKLRLLVKCLIPLPEKWSGLSDVELRYRHRYVDLITNPEVRDVFKKRSKIISTIRSFFEEKEFLEVETPVLHNIAGGAEARPFTTHHNTLAIDMYLRIALELPLKKLVVGGFEKVFEIGRNFRNEGLSKRHNPEFTMLEFYQAYSTYEDLMELTQELLILIYDKINVKNLNNLDIERKLEWDGKTIDLKAPFKKISMLDSIHEIGGISRDLDLYNLENILKVATTKNIELTETNNWGKCLEAVFEELVEDKLINPTYILNHPFQISPLSRRSDLNPDITDRFELYMGGIEVANGFSELNDAEDQRQRFEAQANRKAAGDLEAPDIDEDFLKALEYGLPPTAGEGIGIDRLVMLLTNSSTIRDVLLFPQMKPENPDHTEKNPE